MNRDQLKTIIANIIGLELSPDGEATPYALCFYESAGNASNIMAWFDFGDVVEQLADLMEGKESVEGDGLPAEISWRLSDASDLSS